MNLKQKNFSFYLSIFLFSVFLATAGVSAQKTNFTLVIDAGHGGHDPGAIGAITREKDINLGVALKLGQLIEKNLRDVKVIYTRKTDRYLTLQERADVVNNNHADLFISVHTNAAKSSAATGTETFTLGLAKSKSNLDVAMRENSVILLEDDYKTKYKGFDPNSVDSYIMFEFMQDKYIDKSIDLASNIQKQFVKYARRSDRGVRQAGFWVLHRSACPSVLIELGFISNPAEERFLASEAGQKEMAVSVYNAVLKFKHEHDKKSGVATNSRQYSEIERGEQGKTEEDLSNVPSDNTSSSKTSNNNKDTAGNNVVIDAFGNNSETKNLPTNVPVFKVQIFATSSQLKENAPDFKNIKNASFFRESGFYKYTVGAETDYNKIVSIQRELLSKFPDCFIIAFVGTKKIPAKEALKLIK